MQHTQPLQPQARPSLPPNNAFLTFPTHLPGSREDSQFIEIWHFSLCHFFWLKRAELGGNTFILQAYFDTHKYRTAVQMPLHTPLAFPLVRAVLGNTSRSKSNLGVHLRLRLQGCAATPASPACLVPGPPHRVHCHSHSSAGERKPLSSAPDRDDLPQQNPALPFHLPCVRAHRSRPGTAQMASVKTISRASPSISRASGTGGNCLSSLAVKGREISCFSWSAVIPQAARNP